jgi:hypothetical protein
MAQGIVAFREAARMAEFRLFLKALWQHGGEAVSGIMFTVLGLVWAGLAVFYPNLSTWTVKPWMVVVFGVGLVFLAAFRAWRDEHRAKEKAESTLEQRQAEDRGIDMKCAEIKFDLITEPSDGLLAVLDVQRIVNGSTRDVVLEVSLVAPAYRLGTFSMNLTSPAIDSPHDRVQATVPQFHHIINLKAKSGLGRGYFLFFFGYKQFQGPFWPKRFASYTREEFAKQIYDSELYIELIDRANGTKFPTVLAPGTLDKQLKRREMEAADSKATEQVTTSA